MRALDLQGLRCRVFVRAQTDGGAGYAAGPGGAGGEGGAEGSFDFGVDPNMDPELAMALRVSMQAGSPADLYVHALVYQSGPVSGHTACAGLMMKRKKKPCNQPWVAGELLYVFPPFRRSARARRPPPPRPPRPAPRAPPRPPPTAQVQILLHNLLYSTATAPVSTAHGADDILFKADAVTVKCDECAPGHVSREGLVRCAPRQRRTGTHACSSGGFLRGARRCGRSGNI